MSAWDQLADARIQEWLQRSPEERARTSPQQEPTLPVEVQLTQDIARLDRAADEAKDPAFAAEIRQKASELMLRLMIVLEQQGRPLAARHFAERRRASLTNSRGSVSPQ